MNTAPLPTKPLTAPADFLPPMGTGSLPHGYGDLAHWRQVALAASDSGETALALRCWQHVQRLQPEARDAEFHIACCHALSGRREQAAESFAALAHAASLSPDQRRRALRLARLLGYETI
jgi:hypothetical protein